MKKPSVRSVVCILTILSFILGTARALAQESFQEWQKKDQEQMQQFQSGKPEKKPDRPAARPEVAKPVAVKPEAPKSEAAKPEAPKPTPPKAEADWLVMVYMAADNSLDPASITDLNEMQQVGSSDRVKIVVLYDRAAEGEWSGTRLFLVRKPADQGGKNSWDTSLPTCQDVGERNMGDPAVLRDFVRWAEQQFPAKQAMLVLWNHGGGWRDALNRAIGRSSKGRAPVNPGLSRLSRGICWDDTNGSDFLETREVRAALDGTQKLAILGADACLMAMIEVAYEWRNLADYFVASQNTEPNNGWPYDGVLGVLAGNAGATPRQVAAEIVRLYGASYPPQQNATQSAVDLSKVEAVAESFDAVSSKLAGYVTAGGAVPADLKQYFNSYVFPGNPYLDLDGTLEIVAKGEGFPQDLRAAAEQCRQAVGAALVTNSSPVAGGRGISVYGAFTAESAEYNSNIIQFARDTHWDECLKVLVPVVSAAAAPQSAAKSGAAEWLVMVYQAADNNLDPFAMLDLKEMQKVGSSDRLKIVSMTDRASFGEWTTTRRFLVRKPGDQGGKDSWDASLATCEDLGEINMGNPDSLKGFVAWARLKYPATRAMLVIWNHGGGWRDIRQGKTNPLARGIAWDDTDNGDYLETREVRMALEGQPKLAVIGADACLMAMIEVAYEWRKLADYFVASEEIEPGDGWPYDTVLGALAAKPGMDTRRFAADIVRLYGAANASQAVTLSALDLAKVEPLAKAVDEWAGAMLDQGGTPPADMFGVAGYPHGNEEFRDLDAMLEKSASVRALKRTATEAREALAQTLVANISDPSLGGHGLSIYPGGGRNDQDYNPTIIQFARDTRWDELLKTARAGSKAAEAAPAPRPAAGPDRWAVLVGVKDYQDRTIPDLKYSLNDVEKIRDALIQDNGYDPQKVITLTEKDATVERVRSVLGTDLPRKVKKEDMVMIYFSGHGAAEASTRGESADGTEKYLLLADAQSANLYGTALPMSEFARILGRIPAAKILLIMDTCYSGAVKYPGSDRGSAIKSLTGEGAPASKLSDDYLGRLAGTEGTVVITAARAGEQSMESPRFSMGLFTHYLLDVLKGKADANADGITSLTEAFGYLVDNVAKESKEMGVVQRPVMKGEVSGDFPVAWAAKAR